MFRGMRRNKQILSNEESINILKNGKSGVLALLGDDGYPYAVPISYVYDNSKIYFHSAKTGHKTDAIKKYSKASFCVIDQDNIIPEEYTTYYRSVIAFGKVRIMEDEKEVRESIEKLAIKYHPKDSEANRNKEICRSWNSFSMIEFSIEHLTGKKAREL
ncbi:MAG: pyridoxamine 5'-phosphate oxidase family protein [Ruminococcus sp.]